MTSPVSSSPGSSAFTAPENGNHQPNAIYRTRGGRDLSLRIDTSGLTREEVGDRMAEIGRRLFDAQNGE